MNSLKLASQCIISHWFELYDHLSTLSRVYVEVFNVSYGEFRKICCISFLQCLCIWCSDLFLHNSSPPSFILKNTKTSCVVIVRKICLSESDCIFIIKGSLWYHAIKKGMHFKISIIKTSFKLHFIKDRSAMSLKLCLIWQILEQTREIG